MKHLLLLAVLLEFVTRMPAYGKVINVPADTSTIQAAINIANNGDTVLVADGRYYENILIDNKSIVVASHFLIDRDTSHISGTIIDGSRPVNAGLAGVARIWGCRDTTTVLCGFTITGGFGNRNFDGSVYGRTAGGIAVRGSSALITCNRIVGNVITHSTVPDSYVAVTGGGIGVITRGVDSTFVILRGNLIADNRIEGSFSAGGGIAILAEDIPGWAANYIIEDNVIRNNVNRDLGSWKGMGGGLLLSVAIPSQGIKTIRNNVITGNKVLGDTTFGGGVYVIYTDTPSGTVDNDPGELFYNNVIANNHSDYLGGGVSIWRFSDEYTNLTSPGNYVPRPAFINNTIVNNTAQDGSGFFIMNHIPFLMNTVVWNQPQDSAEWGEIYLGDVPQWTRWHQPNVYGGIEMHFSDVRGCRDTLGNFHADPQLDSTYRLSDSSPCIGAGTDSFRIGSTWHSAPPFCLYGMARPTPAGYPPDIGACENALANPAMAVSEEHLPMPGGFVLSQNYPNPFNPGTTIRYALPTRSVVTLTIFSTLGQVVGVLVEGEMEAGVHEATFDGSGVASGVYYCRMQAGQYVATRRMLLLK